MSQDYVSGLFVDSDIGNFPGTLPLSAINMEGMARTPRPAIIINFRSYSTDCGRPVVCSVEHCRLGLATGPGHAWQLQPCRHHELYGGGRPKL